MDELKHVNKVFEPKKKAIVYGFIIVGGNGLMEIWDTYDSKLNKVIRKIPESLAK